MEVTNIPVNHSDCAAHFCAFCESLSKWLCANSTLWLEGDKDDKKIVNHGDYVVLHTSASAADSLWQSILDTLPGRPTLLESIRINIDIPGDRFEVLFEMDAKKKMISSYLEFYRPTGELLTNNQPDEVG
jgi:hypothetical protein